MTETLTAVCYITASARSFIDFYVSRNKMKVTSRCHGTLHLSTRDVQNFPAVLSILRLLFSTVIKRTTVESGGMKNPFPTLSEDLEWEMVGTAETSKRVRRCPYMRVCMCFSV